MNLVILQVVVQSTVESRAFDEMMYYSVGLGLLFLIAFVGAILHRSFK